MKAPLPTRPRTTFFRLFVAWILMTLTIDTIFLMRSNVEPVLSAPDPRRDALAVEVDHASGPFTATFFLGPTLFTGEKNRALVRLENRDRDVMLVARFERDYVVRLSLRSGDRLVHLTPVGIVSDYWNYIEEAGTLDVNLEFVLPPDLGARPDVNARLVLLHRGTGARELAASRSVSLQSPSKGRWSRPEWWHYGLYAHLTLLYATYVLYYVFASWGVYRLRRRRLHLSQLLEVENYAGVVGLLLALAFTRAWQSGWIAYSRLIPCGALFLLLLPWLKVFDTALAILAGRVASDGAGSAPREGRSPSVASMLLILVSAGTVAAIEWKNAGLFEWDYFVERDYLRTLEILDGRRLHVTGPQLLTGGSTPGFMVYVVYASVLAFCRRPAAIAWLCKLLSWGFLISWWVVARKYFGSVTAAVGLAMAVACVTLYGFSVWPIHPSFTPFFGMLFLWFLQRLLTDREHHALVFVALVGTVLTQLHFSYWSLLLLVLVGVYVLRVRCPRREVLLALGVMLVLYLPYFFKEATTGFQNTHEILSRPRFLPEFASREGIINVNIPRVLFYLWVGFDGVGSIPVVESVAMGVFVLGLLRVLVLANRALDGSEAGGEPRTLHAYVVVALWFVVPCVYYSLYGAWLENRYFLVMAPAIFVIYGAGGLAVVDLFTSTFAGVGRRTAPVALAGMMALAAVFVAYRRPAMWGYFGRGKQYVGDWTEPYHRNVAIYAELARDFGITPTVFRERVHHAYRWPMPGDTIFDEVYQSTAGNHPPPLRVLPADLTYVLLPKPFLIPPYLAGNPQLTLTLRADRPDYQLYECRSLSGETFPNSRNLNVLSDQEHRILEAIDRGGTLRRVSGGTTNDGARAVLLERIPGTNMEYEVDAVAMQSDDGMDVVLTMNSPVLNGYYQEIKTLYGPYVVLRDAAGRPLERWDVSRHLVGGFLVKTPLVRRFHFMRVPTAATLSFGREGYYDRAFMESPRLQEEEVPLLRLVAGTIRPAED